MFVRFIQDYANKPLLIIFLACSLLFLSQKIFAQDGGNVAVRLFETYRLRSIDISPPFELIGESTNPKISMICTASCQDGKIWLSPLLEKDYRASGHTQSKIFAVSRKISIREIASKGVQLHSDLADPAHQNRKYHGLITLTLQKDGSLDIINKVSRRDYVSAVVASESPKNASYEMLRAQAVLVQTLLSQAKDNSLIGDSTNTQCYLGCSLEGPLTRQAAASVWGQKIYYKDLPIHVYYHSTCAGGTSNGAIFFSAKNKNLSYLSAVRCKNCSQSPFWKPTINEISAVSFAKVFGNGLPKIVKSDYTGRPLYIKLLNGKTMSGYDFWISLGQHFGWDKAPGTRFKLKSGNDGNIIIESTGAGHGVGFCQWGATALAKQGKSYREILRYYFPECVVY